MEPLVITYQSHVLQGAAVCYTYKPKIYCLSVTGQTATTPDVGLRVILTAAAVQPGIVGICEEGAFFRDPYRLVPFATDDKTAFTRAVNLGLLEEITVT
jgi:hypothetical protein